MQMSLVASIFLSIMLFSLPGCGDRSGQKTGDQAMHLPEADSNLVARYPDSVGLRLEVSAASEAGGDVRRALQWVDEGLQRDSLQPVLWNRKASLLLSMQDTTGAIGSLLRSLSVDPSQTDILLELGFIYADRRDPAALSVAERILSPAGDPRFQAQKPSVPTTERSAVHTHSRTHISRRGSCCTNRKGSLRPCPFLKRC